MIDTRVAIGANITSSDERAVNFKPIQEKRKKQDLIIPRVGTLTEVPYHARNRLSILELELCYCDQ